MPPCPGTCRKPCVRQAHIGWREDRGEGRCSRRAGGRSGSRGCCLPGEARTSWYFIPTAPNAVSMHRASSEASEGVALSGTAERSPMRWQNACSIGTCIALPGPCMACPRLVLARADRDATAGTRGRRRACTRREAGSARRGVRCTASWLHHTLRAREPKSRWSPEHSIMRSMEVNCRGCTASEQKRLAR